MLLLLLTWRLLRRCKLLLLCSLRCRSLDHCALNWPVWHGRLRRRLSGLRRCRLIR